MPSISQARGERSRCSHRILPLYLLAGCLWLSPASGQEPEAGSERLLAIRVGTLHPISGPSIEGGIILVQGERISKIGKQGEVDIPDGAQIFDLPMAHAYPGLVDAMSGAFLEARELNNRGVNGGTRIIDGLNPYDQLSLGLVKAGVTTAHVSNRSEGTWRGLGTILRPRRNGYEVMPGKETAGLGVRMTSGKTARHILKRKTQLQAIGKSFDALEAYQKSFTKHDEASKEYAEKFAAYLKYHSDQKDSEGKADPEEQQAKSKDADSPRRGRRGGGRRGRRGRPDDKRPDAEQPKPQDQEKTAEAEPKAEGESKPTEKKKGEADKAPERPKFPKAPKKDPAKEALLEVQEGSLRLRIEAHRRDEIRAALALARSQKIQLPVLEFATAAGSFADELADAGVPVLLCELDAETAKLYGVEDRAELAAQLAEAGVPIAFTSGGSIRRGQHLPMLAAMACGHGLSEAIAVRAITLTPAEILGIADQVGSLEPGKIADIIISSGPLLQSKSRILRVFSGGDLQYEAN